LRANSSSVKAIASLAVGLIAQPGLLPSCGLSSIAPTQAEHVITLTGSDLTIEQVIEVARYGAPVQLSAEARQREADNYGLLLEAATEGVAVYWFNRGRAISARRSCLPVILCRRQQDLPGKDAAALLQARRRHGIPARSQRGGNRPCHDGDSRQCHGL